MERENESWARRLAVRIGLLVVATAVYGAVLAAWRSPLMAAYVAAKLPVVFVAATLIVSVFCWMAGLVTGADLRYGEVLDSVFSAMSIAGAILLALAPVVFFFIASGAPDVGTREEMRFAHACMMMVQVLVFSAAGVVGNLTLYRALRARVPSGCLLAALAPILWLFAVSTEAVGFIVVFACVLGVVALTFAYRPVVGAVAKGVAASSVGFKVWFVILVVVALQAITLVRPMLAPIGSERDPADKCFFIRHFAKTLTETQPR